MAPMKAIHKESRADLGRINLRLPSEMLEAIDSERLQRVGNVSRNTWIAEAVQEKLNRDGATNRQEGEGKG